MKASHSQVFELKEDICNKTSQSPALQHMSLRIDAVNYPVENKNTSQHFIKYLVHMLEEKIMFAMALVSKLPQK